jgi:curved DNA-binding protein CbpA
METPMETDPFSVLGLDENAGDDEIKSRYLALVREFPPDLEPERFQAYRAAYEALRTERERLAARLLFPHGGALARLKAASLPPTTARGAARPSEALMKALLVEGIEQATARWLQAGGAPPAKGAA